MTTPVNSFWGLYPEKLPKLLELREKALSAGQMCRKLGCTRNAVIGKMARMGLHSLFRGAHSPPVRVYDTTPERDKRKLRLKPCPKRPYSRRDGNSNLSAPKLPPTDIRLLRPVSESGIGKLITDCSDKECKFGIGYDARGNHLFCGAVAANSSWCSAHELRVFKSGVSP